MTRYADTNFLIRLYLELPESSFASDLTSQIGSGDEETFPVSWLHEIEFHNALQLHVFRGQVRGHVHVTPEQADVAWASFREETKPGNRLSAATLNIFDLQRQSEHLSARHTPRHGFRTYDVVHVASALLLGCDTFWSFDDKASRLAALEGLKTIRR